MAININKVQTDMLKENTIEAIEETNSVPYTAGMILDFSKNLESYLILDWILWDRQWVFHVILSFTKENKNFSN